MQPWPIPNAIPRMLFVFYFLQRTLVISHLQCPIHFFGNFLKKSTFTFYIIYIYTNKIAFLSAIYGHS